MTPPVLEIGMEWFTEQPGGLNRVYGRLLAELVAQGVDAFGLVAGTSDVLRDSGGLARAFSPHDAPLRTRLLALRRAAVPWLRDHGETTVVAAHFALHALPLLDIVGRHPFVVHFHGPWGQESSVEGRSRGSVIARELVERTVYVRADAAIVLSRAFADVLSAWFRVRPDRIHVIPGGVDVAHFANVPTRAKCRAELGWPADRPVVLCVRRLVRRVGIDVLMAAAAHVRRAVPDVLFLVAGTGPLRPVIDAMIAERNLQDTVRMLGFVSEAQLPLAYRAADLTVVPSTALEGFGLVAVESLAAGTPCVVTPVGGLPEIIEPITPQLVVATTDPQDIADVLSSALLDDRLLPTSSECTEYARAHFDWPVIATRVRAVYDLAAR